MSDETTAEEPEEGWARFVGETLSRNLYLHSGPVLLARAYETGLVLLDTINELINRDSEQWPERIPQWRKRELAVNAGEILAAIESVPHYNVPTLTGLETRYGFNPVINILDRNTVNALELNRQPDFNESPAEPSYSPEAAEENPRVEFVDADTAREGFIAMLAGAIRSTRNLLSRNLSPSGPVDFTVHTKLTDYVLDISPEYAITWRRFGHKSTSPVIDKVETGEYFFQGRKGRSLKSDDSRHLVSYDRTQTILTW